MNNLKYRGQAEQDKFVCKVLVNKTKGFFIEVGSQHPKRINNTYLLETELDWSGLMLEIQEDKFKELYRKHRPKSVHVFGDALSYNYSNLFNSFDVPKIVDYLQLDIDPPSQTLMVLELINSQVMDRYEFSVITFEHDYCHSNDYRIVEESRRILKEKGYFIVFENICNVSPRWAYEDWYVHPNHVDMKYVENLRVENLKNYKAGYKEIESTLSWSDISYEF